MKTTTFTGNEPIYTDTLGVFEAFSDILEHYPVFNDLFDNVKYDDDNGVIEYDVPMANKHIKRVFDLTQGTPEVVADLMQWLFSMMDAAANL